MHERKPGRDPDPPSLDDRAFPAVLASVGACLAVAVAASMTETTSLDLVRQQQAEAQQVAAVEPSLPTP